MKYSVLFSDGRRVENEEKDQVMKLKEDGMCEFDERTYILCANPNDPDYKKLQDRSCPGKIYKSDKQWVCPECHRKITEPKSKEQHTERILRIDRDGVRDEIRKRIKSYFDTSAVTISRTYCGISNKYVLDVDDPDVNVFLIFRNRGVEYLYWCEVYNENPAFLLFDNAIPLKNSVEDLSTPIFTLDDFYPEVSESTECLHDSVSDPLDFRTKKANLAYKLSKSNENKKQMSYDDFEQCVQRLLVGSIGNSQLLGSSESGDPVPDGALSLHFEDSDHLYMWDAKFVKISSSSKKTDLRDEYDKIFRHLGDMRNRPQVEKKFTDIQGIILFSPGIEEVTVKRLAEFIQEEVLMSEETWNGMIIYFEYDALSALYDFYRENKANVQKKEETFRSFLHVYLQSLDKHTSDPDVIRESPHKCLHVSVEDIESLFSDLMEMGIDEAEFDVSAHMKYVNMLR